MAQYQTAGGRTSSRIAMKQAYEVLIMLGGALAIIQSSITFISLYTQGIPSSQFSPVMTTFSLGVVLGVVLFVAAIITKKHLINGALVAIVVGVILILFASQAGLISGAVAIVGGVLAAAAPYVRGGKR